MLINNIVILHSYNNYYLINKKAKKKAKIIGQKKLSLHKL